MLGGEKTRKEEQRGPGSKGFCCSCMGGRGVQTRGSIPECVSKGLGLGAGHLPISSRSGQSKKTPSVCCYNPSYKCPSQYFTLPESLKSWELLVQGHKFQ